MFEQELVLDPAVARVPAEEAEALPREPGRDIMFGEIDVIMRRDDRDLRPLAAFGPVNVLARMPARLNARRGRRYAADELRVEAFDAVRVHHHSPDCRFVRLSARNAAPEDRKSTRLNSNH